MSTVHEVQQGEFLAKIARQYGFADFNVLWNHPENAELKKLRQNPNVLLPGDKVVIPDKDGKSESVATGAHHRFQVQRTPLLLRLVLADQYRQPLANARAELHVDGKVLPVTTDADGKIEQLIAPTAGQAELVILEGDTPLKDNPIPIRIGHLDPVEEISGQTVRLRHLGYYFGPLDGSDQNRFTSAVEEFQCDHGLAVDGKCGPATQAALKKVHGC